jgi:hypothetical protein
MLATSRSAPRWIRALRLSLSPAAGKLIAAAGLEVVQSARRRAVHRVQGMQAALAGEAYV